MKCKPLAAVVPMDTFDSLLTEIKSDCACEHIPFDKIATLARLTEPAEVAHLIGELDALDDADLEDDAGDVSDYYWRLRTAYSHILAGIGEPAVGPLIQALQSENAPTRGYAAKALGLMGCKRAFDAVNLLLAREQDWAVRLMLMEALGGIGDERGLAALLPYLKAPEQLNRGWIVRTAANALGSIGTDSVVLPLAEMLRTDPDWFARLGAAEGLRKMNRPCAREALQIATTDTDSRVRSVADTG